MPTISVNGVNVHFTETGSGYPVLCVHTGPGSSTEWRPVSEIIKGGFRLLAIDLYGRGRTDPWPASPDYDLDSEAELVLALIRTCATPVHLVGHSFGGAVSIRVALTSPQGIKSLTLIEPSVYPLLQQTGAETLLAEIKSLREKFEHRMERGLVEEAWKVLIDYYNGEGFWEKLPEKVRIGIQEQNSTNKWDALLTNPTKLEELQRLNLPAKVICGEITKPPYRKMSEIVAENIPNCQFATIDGAGHMSPLTHPAEVSALINSHLLSASRLQS